MADRLLLEDGTSLLLLEDGTSALLLETSSGSSVTATDAVSSSDAAARVASLTRSASDAVTTSDVAALAAIARTASDAVTTSDAATQQKSVVRSASDTVSSSDTTTRAASLTRSESDAVTTSSTVAGTRVFLRSASDTVTSSTTVARSQGLHRTASDTVTLSSAVAAPHSLSRTASDTVVLGGAARAVVNAFTPGVGPGGETGGGSSVSVVIKLGGVDITDRVHLTKSEFVSQVNGQVGTCVIAIKDPSLADTFTIGSRILLTIEGLNVWTGYLKKIKRVYPFPAYASPLMRDFLLIGLEIGVLFQQRVVYRKSNPTLAGPTYPSNTSDATVFDDLFPGYLDLSDDDLDVTSYVTHVGTINEDQSAAPIVTGSPWAETMRQMAAFNNPVWYINADRQLVWADVDVDSAPFGLSDDPVAGERGVQSLVIAFDGTALANDVLMIGSGGGSPDPVSVRDIDQDSIDEHGRWQAGAEFLGSVWKQNTINRLARAYVDGNTYSRRGHKDDRVFASCVTYDHGLRAGMVVHLRSDVWDFQDEIPIRQMRVSWPAHSTTRYELLISHELDSYSLFDPYKFPPITAGGFPTIRPPQIPVLPPIIDIFPPVCDCGITDTFTRTTTSPDMGISDYGLGYGVTLAHNATAHTNGTTGALLLDPSQGSVSSGPSTAALSLSGIPSVTWDQSAVHSFTFSLSNLGDPTLTAAEIFEVRLKFFNLATARIVIIPSNSSLWLQGTGPTPAASAYSQITWTSDLVSGTQIPLGFFVAGSTYTFSVYTVGSNSVASVSNGTTAYTAALAFVPVTPNQVAITIFRDLLGPFTSMITTTATIDDLTIPELTRCTRVQFEDFERTDSDWGYTTPSGFLWGSGGPGGATQTVGSGFGKFEQTGGFGSSGQANRHTSQGADYWGGDFTMTVRFKINAAPNTEPALAQIGLHSPTGGTVDQGPAMAFNWPFGPGGNQVVWFGLDGSRNYAAFTWSEGSSYILEWIKAGTAHEIRVWLTSQVRPSVATLSVTDDPLTNADRFVVAHAVDFNVSDPTNRANFELGIWYDSIDFTGTTAVLPCYYDSSVPVEPTIPVLPTSGRVCENFDGGLGSYQLSGECYPETVQVWVDGILTPGVTATTDGLVDVGFSTIVADTVMICYEVRS